MTSKKGYFNGSREPSFGGRGTTTVKRTTFEQKRSGTNKSSQKIRRKISNQTIK